MTSHMGRLRKVHCLVATGNGNGLVGYGLASGVEARGAVRRAKTRGGQRLMYIQRHEERTSKNEHNFAPPLCCPFSSVNADNILNLNCLQNLLKSLKGV